MAGAAVAWGVARANRRDNQVVPGVATAAPASWAGAHTPEARLHRRVRDAVRAVRAVQRADVGLRRLVEQEALAVDERLVAVAGLPEHLRTEHLTRLTAAVESLEGAATAVVAGGADAPAGPSAADEVHERLRLLAEARAELDLGVLPPRGEPQDPGSEEGGPRPGTAGA